MGFDCNQPAKHTAAGGADYVADRQSFQAGCAAVSDRADNPTGVRSCADTEHTMIARSNNLARRRGSILIVAMLTCFTLASVVLVLSRTMATEAIASANQAAQLQAASIERGGEQYVLGAITDQSSAVLQLTDDQFNAIPVGDGWFWVMRPQYDDTSLPIFGLVDESSKLNLNTANY